MIESVFSIERVRIAERERVINPSLCLSIYLSVCLSVCLSVYQLYLSLPFSTSFSLSRCTYRSLSLSLSNICVFTACRAGFLCGDSLSGFLKRTEVPMSCFCFFKSSESDDEKSTKSEGSGEGKGKGPVGPSGPGSVEWKADEWKGTASPLVLSPLFLFLLLFLSFFFLDTFVGEWNIVPLCFLRAFICVCVCISRSGIHSLFFFVFYVHVEGDE